MLIKTILSSYQFHYFYIPMMAYIGTYIFYNNNKILLLYLIYMRNLGGGLRET